MLKDALHVLMEGTPKSVNVEELIKDIEKTEGIQGIHDLHIWSITSEMHALSCHAVVDSQLTVAESEAILRNIEHELEHKGISHVTIQLETASHRHDNAILCQAKNKPLHVHHHH